MTHCRHWQRAHSSGPSLLSGFAVSAHRAEEGEKRGVEGRQGRGRKRDSGKRREKRGTTINITLKPFSDTSFGFVKWPDEQMWVKCGLFHALLTITRNKSKKTTTLGALLACLKATLSFAKACIVVELEWKGLWWTTKETKVHRREHNGTYLDASTVVGHPRRQRNQHCNVGTNRLLDLIVHETFSDKKKINGD